MRQSDKSTGDINVVLADGVYRLSEPLRFTAEDGGGSEHTVTWAAAPGAHPVISGATPVTGWSLSDASKNVWVANTPAGVDTRDLVVNGMLAPRASIRVASTDLTATAEGLTINSPSLSYLSSLPNQDRMEFETLGDWTNRYSPVASINGTAITMKQPAWDNNTWGWDTVQRSFFESPTYYLENSLSFIDEVGEWYIDPDAGKLYYKPGDGVDPATLDVELPRLEALVSVGGTYDAPVQGLTFSGLEFTGTSWLRPSTDGYANQQNGTYIVGSYDYRPADAFDSCSRGCEAFERARNTWLQRPAAVQVSAASHISFTGNLFTGLGQSALGIGNDANAMISGVGLGAQDVTVSGNRFTEVGGHGVSAGGVLPDAHHPSDPRMIVKDITVSDNTISHAGVDYKDTSGILSTYVDHAVITHNEIAGVPYDGIDIGYGWGINDPGGSVDYTNRGYYNWSPRYTTPTTLKDNEVSGNLIHDTHLEFADGGSIYNLSASPGTTVDSNYVYNVTGNALYLDEGSRYMTWSNNVVQTKGPWALLNSNGFTRITATSDNTLNGNWYDAWDASVYDAEYHNNKLVDNVASSTADWPEGARQVICQSGVRPEFRSSLNANLFGFTGCETDSAVTGFSTTSNTDTAPFFGQSGNTLGIAAAAQDVWRGGSQTDDQYAAIYRDGEWADGDTATVRVSSQNDRNEWAKAGLIARNDMTAPGSSAGYAVLAVTKRHGVVFEWDSDGDGYVDSEHRADTENGRPVYLKLARTGSELTASYSYDGANWATVGTATPTDMGAAQDIGVFSLSHDVTQSAMTIFDHVTLGEAAPDANSSTISSSAASLPADGTTAATITVHLRTTDGTPLTTGGRAVQITTTSGAIGPVTDVGDGSYTASLTSKTPGDAIVGFSVDGTTSTNTTTIGFTAQHAATIQLASARLTPGQAQTVSGSGFPPGGEIEILLASTPRLVGTTTASAEGTLSFSFTIPADLEAGTHTVTARTDSISAEAQFTVSASPTSTATPSPAAITGSGTSGSLATTGAGPGTLWLLPVSGAVILLGAVLLTIRRRQRTAAKG